MPRVAIPAPTVEAEWAHPVLGGGPGPYSHQIIGNAGGLTQFGAHIEILPPGSRSSFRHWHETGDEMVLVLEGEVVLVEETETVLRAGEAACWPAGRPVGHCLENRSDRDARCLVVGIRARNDIIHYPDHDLITVKDGEARRYLHTDGRPRAAGDER
jgi:uncharacterized cupin superfamily protein